MEVATVAAAAAVVSSLYYSQRTAQAQEKQIKASNAAANRDYALKKQQIQSTLAEEQRKNRSLLERQQSAYKAKLGASGLSAKSGSGETALNAMQKEHDIEDKYLVNQSNISLDALLNGINQTNSRNLLALSSASNSNRASSISNTTDALNGVGRMIMK